MFLLGVAKFGLLINVPFDSCLNGTKIPGSNYYKLNLIKIIY